MTTLVQAYCSEVNPEYVSAYAFLQCKERYTGVCDATIGALFRQVLAARLSANPYCYGSYPRGIITSQQERCIAGPDPR